jgi:DNA gyrase/topoisomerase IV subunit A
VRVPLNMNVLDAHHTPRVMGLKEVISSWIAHQFEVLVRRAQHRIAKIEDRVELLEGYLVAYLNLDRVIQIIREEDEPKAVMIAEFALTDRQAEAILNMRLRSLRKLEEMQIKKERNALTKERDELVKLVGSRDRQRTRLKKDLAGLKARYGEETELGRRRTTIEEAGPTRDIPMEAMIEREPITVIMSQRGWIRAMKGHVDLSNPEAMKFKEGDGPRFFFHAQTTTRSCSPRRAAVSTRSAPTSSRRPRLRRAGSADGGHRRGGRHRRLVPGGFRFEASARLLGRARLRRVGGGRRSPRPARASSGQPAAGAKLAVIQMVKPETITSR